ncbi:MAG: methyltransferase family protein [Calditrichia bacterium]
MTKPALSVATVLIQFACIIYLILDGSFLASSPIWLGMQIIGVALGLWAMFVMRRFNVAPDPLEDATLITRGPYRWIRHPMYSALLLVAAGAVLHHSTPVRITVLSMLLVNLIVKLRHEEKLMSQKFAEYQKYIRNTKRLIPFLF